MFGTNVCGLRSCLGRVIGGQPSSTLECARVAVSTGIRGWPDTRPCARSDHPAASPTRTRREGRPWYLQTVQYHPILGWSGYPHYVETNDGIHIQTNSLGYRDREPVGAEDGGKLRVLFLGDSFTWGDEVRVEDRFTSLLEASCGLQCDRLPPIHAINQGIIGYGTAQSFLQYVLNRERHRFDVVVLNLFTGNDLTDNAAVDSPSGPRPRLIRCDPKSAGQELCLEGVPVPAVVDWPAHRLIDPRGGVARSLGWSGLIALASRRRAPRFLIEKRIADGMGVLNVLPFPVVERTSEAAIEDRIGQLEAILGALDRTVRGEGKAFGVLVFPSAQMYAGDAGPSFETIARFWACSTGSTSPSSTTTRRRRLLNGRTSSSDCRITGGPQRIRKRRSCCECCLSRCARGRSREDVRPPAGSLHEPE